MSSELRQQLRHLRRLASELQGLSLRAGLRGVSIRAEPPGTPAPSPYLHVASQDSGSLSERVLCRPDPGQGWQFCWPWHQPIGPADDPAGAARKIAEVLRPVHDHAPAAPAGAAGEPDP